MAFSSNSAECYSASSRGSMDKFAILPYKLTKLYGYSAQMTEIDKIDRKILSILQGDGRIANVELAERIGLSPTSIGERPKGLDGDGFVRGYGARLNPHRLGLGLLVFVEVMLDKTTP